jgi:hypothetical protein
MRRFAWIPVLVGLLLGGAALAQDASTPLANLEHSSIIDFAMTGNGVALFIADAGENQVHVYNASDPANPALLVSIPLEGTPLAVAAARDYAIVAVDIGGSSDLLQVIAPDRYSEGGYGVVAFPEIPDGTRAIVVSADHRWAAVAGANGYSLLELISATDIIGYPTESSGGISAAALGSSMAFIASPRPAQIEQFILRGGQAPREARSLDLRQPASALTVNGRTTLGAIVRAGGIDLFDTASLQIVNTLQAEGGRFTNAQFIAREDGEWLAAAVENSPEILFFDVTTPSQPAPIASLPVGFSARQMKVYDDLLLVSDDGQLAIFQPGA